MATDECRCVMFFSICQYCDNIGNKYLQEKDKAFMKINQINVKNKTCNCNIFYTCKQCYKEQLKWIHKYLNKQSQSHKQKINEMTEFGEWKSSKYKLLNYKPFEEPSKY